MRSQRRAGEKELAHASAERGLQLLGELEADAPSALSELLADARRQIEALRDGEGP